MRLLSVSYNIKLWGVRPPSSTSRTVLALIKTKSAHRSGTKGAPATTCSNCRGTWRWAARPTLPTTSRPPSGCSKASSPPNPLPAHSNLQYRLSHSEHLQRLVLHERFTTTVPCSQKCLSPYLDYGTQNQKHSY